MTEHTPLPWYVIPENEAESTWVIGHGKGDSIGTFEPVGPWMSEKEASANAAIAVKAVNCHAELVKALEEIERDVKDAADHCPDKSARALFQLVQETARAVLSKAKD